MSNRTIEQTSKMAALRVAHEAQIAALTDEGLDDAERVRRFSAAARLRPLSVFDALLSVSARVSPAHVVWTQGMYEFSLFADLPGCHCPVLEKNCRKELLEDDWTLIPDTVPRDWRPTREVLEAFARIQQKARSGG